MERGRHYHSILPGIARADYASRCTYDPSLYSDCKRIDHIKAEHKRRSEMQMGFVLLEKEVLACKEILAMTAPGAAGSLLPHRKMKRIDVVAQGNSCCLTTYMLTVNV